MRGTLIKNRKGFVSLSIRLRNESDFLPYKKIKKTLILILNILRVKIDKKNRPISKPILLPFTV